MLYVANVDETEVASTGDQIRTVEEIARAEGGKSRRPQRQARGRIDWLCPKGKRPSFAPSLGLQRSGLDDLSAAAYDLLGLMTFLTAGEKEARAWPIPKGTKAPKAAGTIHSDLERGFIRAEVVSYDDYVEYRTLEALRAAGRVRSEGREYVMQEGDVVNFRFNV